MSKCHFNNDNLLNTTLKKLSFEKQGLSEHTLISPSTPKVVVNYYRHKLQALTESLDKD